MDRPVLKLSKSGNESFSRKRKRVHKMINKEEELFLSRLYSLQCEVTNNVTKYDEYLRKNNRIKTQLEDSLLTVRNKVASISHELGLNGSTDPYMIERKQQQIRPPIPKVARKEMMHKMIVLNNRLQSDVSLTKENRFDLMLFTKSVAIQTDDKVVVEQNAQTEDNVLDELEEIKAIQYLLYLDHQIERFRSNK